jgi:hypothetical protein
MPEIRRLFVAACAAAFGAQLLIGATNAAGSTTGWSIESTPNPPGAILSVLDSVSCSAAIACTAVGYWRSGPNPPQSSALAERWNGSAWSIQPTPAPVGATGSFLSAVACPGAQLCVAVGFKIGAASAVRGLSEVWNGKHWVIVPMATPPSATYLALTGISCLSSGDCTALGSYIVGTQQDQPLGERWNGTAWALEAVPNPHAENGSLATAVSCTGPAACMATAEYGYGDVDQSVYALRWNGIHWISVTQPNPGGQFANYETSVSCSIADACTSVGAWTNIGLLALAERWNGTKWLRQVVAQPEGSATSALGGVSCADATACTAVGTSSKQLNGVPTTTLAERWNGASWIVDSTPNPSGAEFSTLSSVACIVPTECIAVGNSYDPGTKTTTTLAERHSG